MKWPPTQKAACAACGGSFTVPTPDLLSLQAVCPRCGASLAGAGEERLRWYAGYCREIDLFLAAFELQTDTGFDLPDGEVHAARSLPDLSRAVASRLPPAPDREARAVELVTEAARRVAPDLLHDADFVHRVIRRESEWWKRRATPADPRGPGESISADDSR